MLSQSLARTNAVKNVLNGLANGVAAIGFAAFGPVRWRPCSRWRPASSSAA